MNFKWVSDPKDPILYSFMDPFYPKGPEIAALYDGTTPIAAGYGSINKSDRSVQVEHPKFANPKAMEFFVKALEQDTQKENCSCSILFFYENNPDLINTLEALEWSTPEKWMINCHFDHSFNPPWLRKEYPLPEGFFLKSWSELTPEQINLIRNKGDQYRFPPNLSPFLHSNPDPEHSICLLYENEVIGWMITRRINDSTISYDSFYILQEWRKPTLILALLAKSVLGVINSPIPYAFMEVNLIQTDLSYLNFVYKRYIPYINKYNYTLRSWKLFNS